MKAMPRIEKVMTPMPHTINKDGSLEEAMNLMRKHQIRHLPVLDAGELIGVVSDRDLKLAASFDGAGKTTVDSFMTQDPYKIDPHAALDEVAADMAEHKYGCAVVCQSNGKVVGIFTTVDAAKILAEILKEHYKTVG